MTVETEAQQMLKKIQDSLSKPKPKIDIVTNWDGLKSKLQHLRQAESSVYEDFLSLLMQSLQENTFAVSSKLDGVAYDLNSLVKKVDANLNRLNGLQEGLSQRIKQFSLLEAKYERMINRVNSVLEELERVLKRL